MLHPGNSSHECVLKGARGHISIASLHLFPFPLSPPLARTTASKWTHSSSKTRSWVCHRQAVWHWPAAKKLDSVGIRSLAHTLQTSPASCSRRGSNRENPPVGGAGRPSARVLPPPRVASSGDVYARDPRPAAAISPQTTLTPQRRDRRLCVQVRPRRGARHAGVPRPREPEHRRHAGAAQPLWQRRGVQGRVGRRVGSGAACVAWRRESAYRRDASLTPPKEEDVDPVHQALLRPADRQAPLAAHARAAPPPALRVPQDPRPARRRRERADVFGRRRAVKVPCGKGHRAAQEAAPPAAPVRAHRVSRCC